MKRVYAKYAILLISIRMVFSMESSPGCPLYTWQCNNGQCIKSEELCDGSYDCDDKSDETIEQCLFRPCPAFAFQCAYGACITGNFRCNGIINCVDGSDETRFLCNSRLNYEKEMQGRCKFSSSMECDSGECISSERLCDGRLDCVDGSDETVEVCSFLKCPEYSFRCGYGACVPGLAACDGFVDCKDGSDEIASICPNTTIPSITRKPIPPTIVAPITTSTLTYPTTTATTIGKNTTVGTTTTIGITTTSGTTTTSTIAPITTTDAPEISENYCSSITVLRGISTVASCYYNNNAVSCRHGIRSGTSADISCATGYVEKQMKKSLPSLKCDSDGEWTHSKGKCMPECGTLTELQKENPSKPWEVTIFMRYFEPTYMPICSGVIVSPKIVLTAASCFLNPSTGYNTDHVFYNLIQGFYNESFSDGEYLIPEAHNISSIDIKTMHRTQDLAVLVVVNYFQFSNYLKPICLPTAQSNVFPFYDDNRLNIGRPVTRDTSRIFLEYLIASVDSKPNGRKAMTYVNIYYYIPFINREIKKYDNIL